MANDLIQKVNYEVGGQKIELTQGMVKQYLVNGDVRAVTNEEIGMFMMLCKSQGLNPFVKEAHLIKFGNRPATMIVGKDAFTKRANRNPNYEGVEAGVIVVNFKKEIEYREGSFYVKNGEQLVGGWAKVHTKNKKFADMITVSYDEYEGKKADGKANSNWSTRPGTMIRKVALVQALREAFPDDFVGMYSAEEMGIDETELNHEPVNIEEEQRKAAHVEKLPKMASVSSKNQVMQLAKEKELMTGEGKEADVSKLEELANKDGISLRGMTEDQANQLIKILMEYQIVKDVPEENIQPVEDEISTVNVDVIKENENDAIDEDNPF
ncbi:phage recombination protein Bet [Clostridium botulinum]|uniref:Phage recombination protein Bet n=1 Tax=Clostridium botulinum TaxID=1491 RepID=A0A6B4JHK0_CLOBO|nr:phage recombination protein Bet [Clostridium botulinum]EES50066.1 phage recombination protein Bet [Clostridium botulinum E1 str. 'BoNT E Beluga']MBY6759696.1 phage recombination protein Bet [Clostridium botulinum]MBY6918604.1 phage recombination protein Bet [Clostridium botulinum]MCR1129687.1 phage recombination protein Bet [Clostridium botulinum]NFJ56420.1 phage recombination protein Bet [Clostridium botulinum]